MKYTATTMNGSFVQFGCGTCAPEGWRNFDAGPAFWMQKHLPFLTPMLVKRGYPKYPTQRIQYADVVIGLPVEPQSATAVYCSHVLEHLALSEFRFAIGNVFTYLRSGGRFRAVVPDLEYLVKRYVADPVEEAALRFLDDSGLGDRNGMRGLETLPALFFGRSRHLWMWDYKAMKQELERAGFVDVRRAYFNDSAEVRFKEVEDKGRWENCLGVESRRP